MDTEIAMAVNLLEQTVCVSVVELDTGRHSCLTVFNYYNSHACDAYYYCNVYTTTLAFYRTQSISHTDCTHQCIYSI